MHTPSIPVRDAEAPAGQRPVGASVPSGPSSRRGRRVLAGALAFMTTLGGAVMLAPSASAALSAAGPIDPANNFPSYYTDANGLQLQICQDGAPNCLAGPEQIQDVHAAGGDAEAFYYAADATTTTFAVHLALEAAYAADGPNQEVVFQRTQVTARDGGLVANAVYKVTDPYGTYTCTAEPDGVITQNACRIETTPVEGEFNRALGGRLGPFLTLDPTQPAAPAGYIGDNTTPRKVIGSPTGFNAFRVEGPGLTGTCPDAAGGTISNCEQTDLFTLQGKIQPGGAAATLSAGTLDFGDVPTTPAVAKTLTYANIGSVPVTVNSVAVTPQPSAFAVTGNTCPTAPATLAVGARCTIDVTYTPEAGKASAATLTITDDTPAATRNVALKGSNLGVMFVADPVPPASLAFGTVPVGATSVEDNVVIGNSGNGPLTVSTIALTGASAAHYKLGPNNSCTGTPVAADGGCEIGVVFNPTTTGSKSASLRVTDSTGKIVNVPLSGTGGAADTTAPTVTARVPAVNATGIAVGSNVTATFSEAVTGVDTATFVLRPTATPTATPIAATVTNVAGTNRWVLNPNANLIAGTSYTARLTGGAAAIRDASGNALVATAGQPLSWSFTTAGTAPAGDTTAPTLTARVPAVNATGVAVGTNISATFSEAVQGVSTGTYQLKDPAGNVIPGTVTQVTGSNRWVLDPTATLARNTLYTVTLTGGPTAIRDAAGNPFATTSWSFRTVV